MENNKNKKSVKFQGDMLNFCDFIQVFVFTRNHHLKSMFSPDHSADIFMAQYWVVWFRFNGLLRQYFSLYQAVSQRRRGWSGERRCWVNFQCRGVLLVWMIEGQGPITLAVGAGGGCSDIISLIYLFFFLLLFERRPDIG